MRIFSLGRTVVTHTMDAAMSESPLFAKFVMGSLARHTASDWGDLDDHDRHANDQALHAGIRILSAYTIPKELQPGRDDKIWVVTEADRSVTTILFPSEY